jgi:hypothetical protein
MKRTLLLSVALILLTASSSYAKSYYVTPTGTKYQYNLNNPSDRISYEVDPVAKLRDRTTPNPLRNIDRNLGVRGGGIIQD